MADAGVPGDGTVAVDALDEESWVLSHRDEVGRGPLLGEGKRMEMEMEMGDKGLGEMGLF